MRAVACLLAVLFLAAASSAVAQEKHLIDPMLPGSLNPKPLPPLKNPNAPLTASAATTTARSCRSTTSSAVMASMYDAALAEMDVGELPVGVGEIDFDGAGDLRTTAPHLGDRVLEPLGQLDARPMLVAGHRIA